jgi:DnaJ family protein C protein 13
MPTPYATGIDYAAKKHSLQRGGLVDTILRVRSASIVKMVNMGHRSDYKVIHTGQ